MTRYRTFWIGLALRFLALPLFGSWYLKSLFIPFIDHAILAPLANPWSSFPSENFPYGTVLFAMELIPKSIGYSLFGHHALGTTPLSLALMKLPLLALDLALLLTLARFTQKNIGRVLWFYWLNPALFYITYVHGQLDVASIAFAAAALYCLSYERLRVSALAFSAALLCKFHVIAILPFMMAYVWNTSFPRQALRKLATYFAIVCVVTGAGFLPQLQAHSLNYVTFSSPQAMRMFATKVVFSNNEVLYLGMCLVLFLIGRLAFSDRITARGLLLGSGLAFGGLVLVTNPMPGWYFWVLPFLAVLYATYSQAPRPLHVLFQLAYFAYFVVIPRLAPENELARGLALSLLQTSLAAQMWFIYRCIGRTEIPLKERVNQLKIGIAGDSGAGKSHLTLVLQDLFGSRESLVLEGDNYHKWERKDQKWVDYTHLSPHANNLSRLSQHTSQLVCGQTISSVVYDHTEGVFQDERTITPSRTLLVQGLHALYPRSLRAHYDLKIFVQPDAELLSHWKLKRDVRERGHAPQAVLDSIMRRSEDARRYVQPQADFADWIIRYRLLESAHETEPKFEQMHCIWNDVEVDGLIEELMPLGEVRLSVDDSHIDRNRLTCGMRPPAEKIAEIAGRLFPNLRQLTRSRSEPVWHDGFDGISQLVALTIIDSRRKHASVH